MFLVPPQFTTKPSSLKWTTTDAIELKCAASGSPAPSLSWLKNGNELSSLDAAKVRYYEGGADLTISSVTSSDSGMYQCLAENIVGNVQATASVIVHRSGEIIVMQTFFDVCTVNCWLLGILYCYLALCVVIQTLNVRVLLDSNSKKVLHGHL